MKPFVVLDTETAPEANFDKNNMDKTSLVYDLGYVFSNGKSILRERSFVIAETFFNTELMQSAYYADKLPQYRAGLGTEWQVVSFIEAWNTFKADCKEFGIKDMYAYNARFDRNTLNHTIEHYSNGFVSWFFPYKMNVKDIWTMAGDTICNTKKYVKWCMRHGYVSPSGNPRTTAEAVYRYLMDNHEFVEAHTALNDAQIEEKILRKIRKRHQKAGTKPNGSGWRKAAKIAEEL